MTGFNSNLQEFFETQKLKKYLQKSSTTVQVLSTNYKIPLILKSKERFMRVFWDSIARTSWWQALTEICKSSLKLKK